MLSLSACYSAGFPGLRSGTEKAINPVTHFPNDVFTEDKPNHLGFITEQMEKGLFFWLIIIFEKNATNH